MDAQEKKKSKTSTVHVEGFHLLAVACGVLTLQSHIGGHGGLVRQERDCKGT